MHLALQIWGGGFYLFNKILLAIAEKHNKARQRKLRIYAWTCYLVGVPAWLIILIEKNNWIAASIQAGGVPAMLLGLYNAYHSDTKNSLLFNSIVTFFTYFSLLAGISYSVYYHAGLTSFSQILEIGVMLGSLIGSHYLARKNPVGWLFFMLMNLSMALLMLVQSKYILMFQQFVSLSFVIYGYKQALDRSNQKKIDL